MGMFHAFQYTPEDSTMQVGHFDFEIYSTPEMIDRYELKLFDDYEL
jgi:hypothetical protein